VTQLDRLFLFGAKIWAQRQVAQQSEDMRFATAVDNTADCFLPFCTMVADTSTQFPQQILVLVSWIYLIPTAT
jgi:hypothetical protein